MLDTPHYTADDDADGHVQEPQHAGPHSPSPPIEANLIVSPPPTPPLPHAEVTTGTGMVLGKDIAQPRGKHGRESPALEDDVPLAIESGNAEKYTSAMAEPPAEHDDRIAASRRASRAYSWRAVLVLLASTGGFAPLFHYFFAEGRWYHNIMFQDAVVGPRMHATVSVHAFIGLAWTIIAMLQIFSGATKGDVRRSVHRVLGRYGGLASMLAMVLTACFTDTRAMILDPSKFSPRRLVATYGLSAYTLAAFLLAYRAALRKDYATHKDMIVMSISLSCLPGIQRIFWYIMQASLDCEVTESVAARLQVRGTLLVVMVSAYARLGRLKNKLNLAFVVLFAMSMIVEIPTLVEHGIHPCEARRGYVSDDAHAQGS